MWGLEKGKEGVCIELKGKSGPKQKAQATTDASGHYAFDKLAPGTYIVKPSLKKCVFAPDVAEIALTAAAPSATADFRGALK